jgi:hypothetical protein
MRRIHASWFATAALSLTALGGCASVGLTPVTPSQPVARQQLKPEYRVFYDALRDYGEWVSIEPVGFVFRPNVVWNQWEPFADGYWAPTDIYGWVWISSEPFGWATYHYGQWFFDQFQGWVWEPGSDWGPAWVRWTQAGDYVGWAPLPPPGGYNLSGSTLGAPPPSAMHFAPISALGSTDLRQRIVAPDRLGHALADAKPVRNMAQHDGVTINLGPPMDLVERRTGPLQRAKIEDLVPVDLGRRAAAQPRPASGAAGASGGASQPTVKPSNQPLAPDDPAEITRRAAEQAADEARRLSGVHGAAPASIPVVRPLLGGKPAAEPGTKPGTQRAPERSSASADSTR